jgi:hypothetical protein
MMMMTTMITIKVKVTLEQATKDREGGVEV